jgi:hypothetical protein
LRRAVELSQDEGQLSRVSDAHQIAFEIHGLILALHYEARFLRNPIAADRARQGFQHILARYAGPGTPAGTEPISAPKPPKLVAVPKARRKPTQD